MILASLLTCEGNVTVIGPKSITKQAPGPFDTSRDAANADLWWYGSHGLFQPFKFHKMPCKPGVYRRMWDHGILRQGRESNIIFLVHGWHGVQSSFKMFFPMLRFHQKLTPSAAVILVDWGVQGSDQLVLAHAATSSVQLNITDFLVDIDPKKSKVHCIGHSLGGHACAAICRSYYNLHQTKCQRIVALDPASIPFKHNSPWQELIDRRVSKHDADYVAVFLTNRNLMGLHDFVGDEYIMTNGHGYNSYNCPSIGKWWGRVCAQNYAGLEVCEKMDVGTMMNSAIIPHTKDSCSHMMALPEFMKSLDVRTGFSLLRFEGNPPKSHHKGHLPSVWNGYVVSKDYRYDTFFNSETIVYSTHLDTYGIQLKPAYSVTALISRGCQPQLDKAYHEQVINYGSKYQIISGLMPYNAHDGSTPFMEKIWFSYEPCTLHAVRRMTQQGFVKNMTYGVRDGIPMPGHTIENLWCSKYNSPSSLYYGLFYCKNTYQYWHTNAYRSMMSGLAKNSSLPSPAVPPTHGCLFDNTNSTDLLRTYLGSRHLKTNQRINIKITETEWQFSLIRVTLWDPSDRKVHTLMTYWDSCQTSSPVNMRLDRTTQSVNIYFTKPGEYWMSFFFEWEEVKVRFNVTALPTPKPPTTTPTTTTTTTTTITTPSSTTATTATSASSATADSQTSLPTPCDENEDEDCWFASIGGNIYTPVPYEVPSGSNGDDDTDGEVDYSDFVIIGEDSNYKEGTANPNPTATIPEEITITISPGTREPMTTEEELMFTRMTSSTPSPSEKAPESDVDPELENRIPEDIEEDLSEAPFSTVPDNEIIAGARVGEERDESSSALSNPQTTPLVAAAIVGAVALVAIAVMVAFRKGRTTKKTPPRAIYIAVPQPDVELPNV